VQDGNRSHAHRGALAAVMPTPCQRWLLLAPLGLALLPGLIVPALLGLASTFTDYAPARPGVHPVGLSNYAAVLADPQFRAAFRTVGTLALVAVPVELAIGILLAYVLREPFRGRGAVRVLLLVPWAVSPIAAGVMWHFLYDGTKGLPSYWLALLRLPTLPSPLGLPGHALPAVVAVDVWRKAPLAGFLLLPGLLTLPPELWEQATLDGIAPLGRLRHLVVPRLHPMLLMTALLLVADTLVSFESILMLTGGGPGSETLTPALYSYQQAFLASNWPAGVTAAWLTAGMVFLVGGAYLLAIRRSVELEPGAADGSGTAPPGRRGGPVRLIVLTPSVLAIVLPLLWTALASVGVVPDDARQPPAWTWPPSLGGYTEVVVAEPAFPRELATTVALSTTATVLTAAIAFLASYSLSRWRARGMPMLVQGFLVLATLPVMAYVVPLGDLARRLHLHDTFGGVALASVAVYAPLAVFILWGYLSQIPVELEEVARLDGASVPQVLRAIVAPAAAPGLAATSVLVFILNWNLFLVPLALALPRIRTIPVAVSDFFLFERDLDWPTAAAALVASLAPVVVLVAAAYRALEHFRLGPSRGTALRT